MWLKLFPAYHPPSADGDSSLGGILPTAFGGWKLFPSVYFLRNFSLMKYRLNGRIFTPGVWIYDATEVVANQLGLKELFYAFCSYL